MKKRTISAQIYEYPSVSELAEKEQMLIAAAIEAQSLSYSPYSKYPVGAALLLANGEIAKGANQENASYPVGICAERVALSHHAVNHHDQLIVALAVVVNSEGAAAPCGICRQSLLEAEFKQKSPIKVFMKGSDDVITQVDSIADIMPMSFTPDFLDTSSK